MEGKEGLWREGKLSLLVFLTNYFDITVKGWDGNLISLCTSYHTRFSIFNTCTKDQYL